MNRSPYQNFVIKCMLMVLVGVVLWASQGHCQDTSQLLGQVAKIYTGSEEVSGNNLIAGFSLGGLIGGILFGSIGFIAFMYGKKNSEFRPLILGILLMGYPYFLKNTIGLYLVGIALTVALFVWRE